MEVFSASPFRAIMEAHGEDSDGLDYESPVEPEQTTRAVASSGSPSRQILRDAPKAVPDRAPRGKHDRRAARRRPIQAPESVYQSGSTSRSAMVDHDTRHHTRAPTMHHASHSRSHTTTPTTHNPRSDAGAQQRCTRRAGTWPGRSSRGRRAVPASTSTTERHNQPA